MSKKQVFLVIILSIIFSWVVNLFFGRQFQAKISTLPLLNRWHILSPDTPIVITNKETVTVSGGGDLSSVANSVKSKISAVVLVTGSTTQITGSAVNLTSDGNFVTGSTSFPQAGGNYYIILNDGRNAKILSQVIDPATSLVFLKTNLTEVSVVDFKSSKTVNPGETVVFESASLQNFSTKVLTGLVDSVQSDIYGQIFQSDLPRRSFSATVNGALVSGEAIFDTSGKNLGIWNSKEIISSDVLKQAFDLYLEKPQKISRSSYGFSYQVLGQLQEPSSPQILDYAIKTVTPNSPAKQAGLLPGDIIDIVISDNEVGSGANDLSKVTLEEVLQKYQPGDLLNVSVTRNQANINLQIKVGELK